MIQNRNLGRGAKSRYFSHHIDLTAGTYQAGCLYSAINDIKIKAVDIIYSVASSTHTQGEKVRVGIPTNTNKYVDGTISVSQAIGTVVPQTLLSTALVTKGTPIIVMKDTITGTSNTGEIDVVIRYELVDTTSPQP